MRKLQSITLRMDKRIRKAKPRERTCTCHSPANARYASISLQIFVRTKNQSRCHHADTFYGLKIYLNAFSDRALPRTPLQQPIQPSPDRYLVFKCSAGEGADGRMKVEVKTEGRKEREGKGKRMGRKGAMDSIPLQQLPRASMTRPIAGTDLVRTL